MAFLTFIHCAKLASRAEQQGLYSKAQIHWCEAAGLARKEKNRLWAEHRASFCLKAMGGRFSNVQVNSPAI
ncbi:ANR family transcriptional regulator [Providencia manganoxydans]|uniref:ANR family transcriptional regulator n=1 Tax=Providencia manganoxydans TaxID=2923283 RepID=UPI0034E3AD6A